MVDAGGSTLSQASHWSMHSPTDPPSGWASASAFSKSNRFQPNISGTASGNSGLYFSGTQTKADQYPGPGTHNPFPKSSMDIKSNSLTRSSYLARRARYTAPLPMSRAIISLHGADQLLLPPGPDPGTYTGAAISSFKKAFDDKGRSSSTYKSNCSRFARTITEESTDTGLNGAPEVEPPCKINTTIALEWGKHILKKENLRLGSVRLGNFKEGECSGEIELPAPGTWTITFRIKCGEKFTADSWTTHDKNDTTEFIINGDTVRVVPNIPEGNFNSKSGMKDNGTTIVSTQVKGKKFAFTFKFRSSSKKFLSHQMVMDGTATCVAIASGFRTRKSIRSNPHPRIHVSKPNTIKRKQYSKQAHPWAQEGQGGGKFTVDDDMNDSGYVMEGSLHGSMTAPDLRQASLNQSEMGNSQLGPAGAYMSGSVRSGTAGSIGNNSMFSGASVLRTSATNLVASLSQPSWKETAAIAQKKSFEVDLVRDLENFVEPKTRNIRFY